MVVLITFLTKYTNRVKTTYTSWSDSNESYSSSDENVPNVVLIAREDFSIPSISNNVLNVDVESDDEEIGQDLLDAKISKLFQNI